MPPQRRVLAHRNRRALTAPCGPSMQLTPPSEPRQRPSGWYPTRLPRLLVRSDDRPDGQRQRQRPSWITRALTDLAVELYAWASRPSRCAELVVGPIWLRREIRNTQAGAHRPTDVMLAGELEDLSIPTLAS